jgi:hypothetical protein
MFWTSLPIEQEIGLCAGMGTHHLGREHMTGEDDTGGAGLFTLVLQTVERETAGLKAALASVDYLEAWRASCNLQDLLTDAEQLARSDDFGGLAAMAKLARARAAAEPLIAVAPDPRLLPRRRRAAVELRWRMGLGGLARRRPDEGPEVLVALAVAALRKPMSAQEMLQWLASGDHDDEPSGPEGEGDD